MRIIKQDLEVHTLINKTWYIIWRKNILSHREDGPAVIWSDGAEYFRIKGEAYNNGRYWNEIYENY